MTFFGLSTGAESAAVRGLQPPRLPECGLIFERRGGCGIRTEYLLRQEVERVLAALTPSNRLVMRIILHTGLRVSDVLRLRPEQLRSRVWVTESKTGKRRQVGFPADLLADLHAEAGVRWVFPGRDPTRHRTRQAVWADVKRAAWAFRLPQNVGTHSARKVYAVRLMERYGDIKQVQRVLRHSSPAVTAIYAMADELLMQRYHKKRAAP